MTKLKLILFLIVLCFGLSHGDLLLTKYKILLQEPIYGVTKCAVPILFQLHENVTGVTIGVFLPVTSHPSTYSTSQFTNDTTIAVKITFTLDTNTTNTLWFTASDQLGSYNFTLPNDVQCRALPQTINVLSYSPPSSYVYLIGSPLTFELDFEFRHIYDIVPVKSCTTNSTLYYCSESKYTLGQYIYQIGVNVVQNDSLSYYDPISVSVVYKYGQTNFTFNFVINSFLNREDIGKVPVVSPRTSWYPSLPFEMLQGQQLPFTATMTIKNISNPKVFIENPSVPFIPLHGNMEETTYVNFLSSVGSANMSVYQLGGHINLVTNYPNDIIYIRQSYPFSGFNQSDPNFYYLLQVDSYTIQDYSELGIIGDTAIITQYPFGYTFWDHTLNGTNIYNSTKLEYHVTLAARDNITHLYIGASYRSDQTNFNYQLSPGISDSTAPKINNAQLYLIDQDQVLIVVNITDDSSGANYLLIGSWTYVYLSDNLIKGNRLDGVYAAILPYDLNVFEEHLAFAVYDYNGNARIYQWDFFNIDLDNSPTVIPSIQKLKPQDLTYWKVFSTDFDTSKGTVNATLFFNVTNPDKDMVTQLYVVSLPLSSMIDTIKPLIYWDYTNNMFRSDFQIQGRSRNSSLLLMATELFSSLYINTIWKQDMNPRFNSNFTDKLPPYISSWVVFPSSNVLILKDQAKTTIGFNVTVLDQPNGLKEGEVQFVSNIDGLPYIFQFNDTTRIAGDIYNGTYRFTFDILNGTCVNQTFYPLSISLTDTYGSNSKYPGGSAISPIYDKVRFGPGDYISVICEQESVDLVLPYIANFSFTPKSIDFRSSNRNITFTLTTRDDESGLSPRHNPVVYIYGATTTKVFSIYHTSKTIHNTSSTTYQYSTTLPYAFSPQNVMVSVYGIADNYLNLKGYSTLDLKNSSLDYFIITQPSTVDQLIISSCTTRLYQHGGKLSILGRGFGDDKSQLISYVDYQDGRGFVQVPTIIALHLASVIQVDQVNSKFILAKFQVGLEYSNEFRIDRTEYQPVFNFNGEAPPEPPEPLVCSNNCSGNGNCTFNGCVCQDPWYGPSCSTKTIIVPPSITNTSDPVIIIDTGGGNGDSSSSTSGNSTTSGGSTTGGDSGNNQGVEVKSIISIYSLREITLDGQKVNEFFPSNWTFNNETNIDGSNGLKFHYSSKLKNRDTIFNVTIQYFTNQSTIEFAGQPITLPPYSTKMSMSLDGYKFNSYLNNLQIIMNIELMTPNQGVQCTSKQYGLGGGNIDDLQWMKLNIDDKSLYGNFIRRGIIDGRVTSIKNSLLDNSFSITKSEQLQQTYIGINIPTYRTSAVIDPDFSHLLNVGGDSYNDDDCAQSSQDKGLKTGAIVGIVVGAAIAVALIIGITVYLRKKRRESKSNKVMQAKLKRISQTQ